MKKLLICAMTALTLCVCLSGCGKAAVRSEKGMAEDLQDEREFIQTFFVYSDDEAPKINKISVIKRQTDYDARTDIVYVEVECENATAQAVQQYKLTYALYNEGWLFETAEPYNEEQWAATPLAGVSEEKAAEDFSLHYLRDYPEYDSATLVSSDCDLEEGTCAFIFTVEKHFPYMTRKQTAQLSYYFPQDGAQWMCGDWVFVLDEQLLWDVAGEWRFPRDSSDFFAVKVDHIVQLNILSFDCQSCELEIEIEEGTIFSDRDEYKGSGSFKVTPGEIDGVGAAPFYRARVALEGYSSIDLYISAANGISIDFAQNDLVLTRLSWVDPAPAASSLIEEIRYPQPAELEGAWLIDKSVGVDYNGFVLYLRPDGGLVWYPTVAASGWIRQDSGMDFLAELYGIVHDLTEGDAYGWGDRRIDYSDLPAMKERVESAMTYTYDESTGQLTINTGSIVIQIKDDVLYYISDGNAVSLGRRLREEELSTVKEYFDNFLEIAHKWAVGGES